MTPFERSEPPTEPAARSAHGEDFPPAIAPEGFFRIAGGPAVSRVSPALEANPAPVRAASNAETPWRVA